MELKEKKFKVKIRLLADHYVGEGTGDAKKSVTEVVNEWYQNEGMATLLSRLNKENLLDNSYLNNFRSEPDSVDKEAYD